MLGRVRPVVTDCPQVHLGSESRVSEVPPSALQAPGSLDCVALTFPINMFPSYPGNWFMHLGEAFRPHWVAERWAGTLASRARAVPKRLGTASLTAALGSLVATLG